jgi:hypothetical protein
MSDVILPRSPKETMAGWVHLPRFVDKIRLHLAGRLPADYQPNLTKGFDGKWLAAAGVTAEQFMAVVRDSITDGQVCDWVTRNVNPKREAERRAFNEHVLNHGREDEPAIRDRLKLRKEQSGLSHRDDVRTFVDYIDADEKRS